MENFVFKDSGARESREQVRPVTTRVSSMDRMVEEVQRETEAKGMEEFVGEQRDYRGNSRFEWEPA